MEEENEVKAEGEEYKEEGKTKKAVTLARLTTYYFQAEAALILF